MKKIVLIIAGLFITGVIFTSCNNEPSLQEYYVEKQESNSFIALDLPSSIINLKEDVSPETKEVISSIKKLNILAFKLDDSNAEEYNIEYDKVQKILKNEKYNELVKVKHENANIILKYLGSDDAIDEFILFVSDKNKGFALARIIGNNMDPAKMMKLAQNMDDFNADSSAFAGIEGLIKDFDID
jgi:hypothetical protein